MIRSIILISLSKIAHQICSDDPFCQKSNTTERALGVGFGGNRKGGGGGGGREGGGGGGGGVEQKLKSG